MTPDDADLAALIAIRRARRRRRRAGRRFTFGLAAIAVVVIAALTGAAFTGRALVLESCNLNSLRPVALGSNSFLFAADGTLLGVIPSSTNRQPLAARQDVALAPEGDGRDRGLRGSGSTARSTIGASRGRSPRTRPPGTIVEGGSTITQQLVRNLYIGRSQRTLARKLKEACLAQKLAGRWTKKQILAGYLNEVVLRSPRVRRTGRCADVLLDERAEADADAGGNARRSAAGAVRVRPAPAPGRCARTPERGAPSDGEQRRHHARRSTRAPSRRALA